uniref:Uncharacterized protein n=1 Tax=Panagrellus redivivus TaxID=6233 RepID=A0A7E4UVF0_PANRE
MGASIQTRESQRSIPPTRHFLTQSAAKITPKKPMTKRGRNVVRQAPPCLACNVFRGSTVWPFRDKRLSKDTTTAKSVKSRWAGIVGRI